MKYGLVTMRLLLWGELRLKLDNQSNRELARQRSLDEMALHRLAHRLHAEHLAKTLVSMMIRATAAMKRPLWGASQSRHVHHLLMAMTLSSDAAQTGGGYFDSRAFDRVENQSNGRQQQWELPMRRHLLSRRAQKC